MTVTVMVEEGCAGVIGARKGMEQLLKHVFGRIGMWSGGVVFCLGVACGCSSPKGGYQYQPAVLEREIEDGGSKVRVPDTGRFLYSDSPEVVRAVKEFEKTGRAPRIRKAGFIQYPYAEDQPILYCQPLRACDVELEVGEEILGIALGDTVRWDVNTIFSGDKASLVPHLVLKPKELDISTNLIVSTTRRTYHMGLISSERDYVRHFKFYYPHEMLQFAASKEELRARKVKEEKEQLLTTFPSLTAAELNFEYSIENDDGVRWAPVRAFDDGKHVYVQMPQLVRSDDAPVLLVRRHGSNMADLVNYRVKRNYYIVDRLFEEAVLILGVGDKQERVVIVRGS